MSHPVRNVLVLGGGTAGLLAALALRRRLAGLPVTVLRSPDVGTIGVGEGTTVAVPAVLHGFLGIDPAAFHRDVRPTWKLGIRFLRWGPRPWFHYTFGRQVDWKWDALPRNNGFYCDGGGDDDFA